MISSATLPPIRKRFVSILYFEAFDKLIAAITDHFQQPHFIVHKIIQDIFVELYVI